MAESFSRKLVKIIELPKEVKSWFIRLELDSDKLDQPFKVDPAHSKNLWGKRYLISESCNRIENLLIFTWEVENFEADRSKIWSVKKLKGTDSALTFVRNLDDWRVRIP